MKPEAQRIAIAKGRGFRNIRYEQLPTCRIFIGMIHSSLKQIPDYPNDLNAMHEAEEVLTDRLGYLIELGGCVQDAAVEDWWLVAHATAAQRAEAFLKTIGKWEEE